MCGRIKEMQYHMWVISKIREGPQSLFLFMMATQSRGVALHKINDDVINAHAQDFQATPAKTWTISMR